MPTEVEDPVLAAFDRAPVDDRPETEEERAAVEAAKAEFRASGRMVPHAEVVAAIKAI
jgi:hypothetical protein